jgi:hypothetical protein
MAQWQSGLLSYPLLLISQVLIILLSGKVCWDFTKEKGYFATPSRRFGNGLMWFGTIYFASMVVRYALTMALRPERRWISGTIPIVFHCILATFVLMVAAYHRFAPRN